LMKHENKTSATQLKIWMPKVGEVGQNRGRQERGGR
jgi:hypothetical protein